VAGLGEKILKRKRKEGTLYKSGHRWNGTVKRHCKEMLVGCELEIIRFKSGANGWLL
jgi:hypothetical protein